MITVTVKSRLMLARFYTCFLFVFPRCKNVNVKCDLHFDSMAVLLRPISDVFVLAVHVISCFETSNSKILPVKYSSQSYFDSLDFDID